MAQRKPALWCSVEVHAAVDGAEFPATREELLSRAYSRNAPEGVLVALSQLDATQVYADVGDVCADVEHYCSLFTARHQSVKRNRNQNITYSQETSVRQDGVF